MSLLKKQITALLNDFDQHVPVLHIARYRIYSKDNEETVSFAKEDELSMSMDTEKFGGPSDASTDEHDSTAAVSDLTIDGSALTTWEAGWNVTNAIQGIFVVGLPYIILHTGYYGILLISLSACLCCYTGKILISCLYEETEDGRCVRVRDTYEEIAKACYTNVFYSRLAGTAVNITQLLELIMTCILYLVVSLNLLSHSFPSVSVTEKVWSPIVFIILLPCVFIKNLKIVSKLSLLCSLAHFVIIFVIITYCLTQIHMWSWRMFRLSVDLENVLISVGAIIFSYTSQIFLPSLERNMRNKKDFRLMLTWTHISACILKTTFAISAVVTWGENTREVISDNLPTYLETLVNVCLLAKALLSYPLPFYSAIEILNSCIFNEGSFHNTTMLFLGNLLRVLLLLLTLLLAIHIPYFSLLMGLTGSISGAAMTLLFPPLFHLKLKWHKLSLFQKSVDLSIFVLGFLCSVTGLTCSIKSLYGIIGRN